MLQTDSFNLDMLNVNGKQDSREEHAAKSISVWNDYGVKNDSELRATLLCNDWNIIKCKCSNRVDIITCQYDKVGNPVCDKCHRSLG